jgi:ABC-type multidrug transport system fused ATPase/permease subunit
MLETGLAGMTWNDKRLREPLRARVLEELTAMDIAPDVAEALAELTPRRTELQNPSHIPLALLCRHLPMINDLTSVTGGITVVVGPTGAGKTTALSLLYRAYDPAAGRITIDGIDIRTVSLTSLRSRIAVVFQNPGLLYRSIAENLRIGKPEASDAELETAALAAEAHHFVAAKPDGYDAMVAEHGKSLSGGERQRLSIARAMLKDAPILILDEATSALDNTTEARVQRALAALVKGRTTFVIAHRLSTVRSADTILVIKDGRLIEQGRYQELVRLGGVFAELDAQGKFVADAQEPPAPDVQPS